ncbi:MAG: nuclear transport factor 2 family protein [Pseudomonadota bacterium]
MAFLVRMGILFLAMGIAGGEISAPSFACTCPPMESAAAQAEEADLIALARMEGDSESGKTPYGTPERIETEFTLLDVLKGDALAGDSIQVMSPSPGSPTCGIRWRGGVDVLVLLNARETGGYSAWMCSMPQFSEAEFREALGVPAEMTLPKQAPLTGTVDITSPQAGERVEGPLIIKGTLPGDWFFENTARGVLISDGNIVGEIPISPISSQNWTEPGDKTVHLEVSLANTVDTPLTLRIEQSMPGEGLMPQSVSIPFVAAAPVGDPEAQAVADITDLVTRVWPERIMAGDMAAYLELLHGDYRLVDHDGKIRTRDVLEADFAEKGFTSPDAFDVEIESVRLVTQASALAIGEAISEIETSDGDACESRYTFSHALKRFDGTWSLINTLISGRETTCTDP